MAARARRPAPIVAHASGVSFCACPRCGAQIRLSVAGRQIKTAVGQDPAAAEAQAAAAASAALAAAEAERQVQRAQHGQTIGCHCPSCGAPLRLVLANAPQALSYPGYAHIGMVVEDAASLIDGPALLGMADLFVGVTPSKHPAASKSKPKPTPPSKGGGNRASPPVGKYGKVAYNPAVAHHGEVLQVARRVLTQGTAAAKAAAAAATTHRRPTTLTNTTKTHVGAAPPVNLTAKQKRAMATHQSAVAHADAAARTAGQAALKAKRSLAILQQQATRQQATAARLFGKGRRAHLGALIEEAYTEIGALPDPHNPGYLETGDPDPIYETLVGFDSAEGAAPAGGDPGAVDPNATDPNAAPPDDGSGAPSISFTDLDLSQLPAPPPMNTYTADYKAVNGVPYDESKGRPPGFLVTFNLADSTNPTTGGIHSGDQHGYLFGGRHDMSGWPGEDGTHWIAVHGHRGGRDWWDDMGDWSVTPQIVQRSMAEYNSPIVGNPMFPEFKAARVDASGTVFWYPQEAPSWLTAPLLQAAAITKQATAKAAADAAAAQAAASAKAQADAQEAQAQQDAQNALAESQAASDAKVAQAQAQGQQATIETQAQQASLQLAQQQIQQAAQGPADDGGGYDPGDGGDADDDSPMMGPPPDDGGDDGMYADDGSDS